MTDREKLVELLTAYYGADPAYYDVDAPSLAAHLLANGVVVREKGEWERKRVAFYVGCPYCGCYVRNNRDEVLLDGGELNFCPNCGADMRKGENG